MTALRRFWVARPLPLRVAAVVTVVGLVLFLLLAKASTAVVAATLTRALDTELAAAVAAAAPAVVAGHPLAQVPGTEVRVLDRAGTPVDGGGPAPLSTSAVRRLLAGQAVWTCERGSDPTRWSGRVVSAPDGMPRLVVAGAASVAHAALVGRTAVVLVVAAVLAALVIGGGGLGGGPVRVAPGGPAAGGGDGAAGGGAATAPGGAR